MNQEMLNKILELSNQITRLEQELKGYIHDEEASEPIKYNIDKRKWELEELLIPVKEELNEKEEQKNIEIEKITKEANDRIERLEKELKGYIHDEEASGPIQYNIDKIKWELEEKVKNINEQYETEKDNILNEIEKTGIDLKEYGLKEKEKQIEEKESTDSQEKINNSKLKVEESEEKLKASIEKVKTSMIQEKPQVSKPQIINPIIATESKNFMSETDSQLEDIDTDNKELESVSNDSVRIMYSAKYDRYIVRNVNTGEDKIVKRNSIEKVDRELLAEKLGKNVDDLKNVDTNIFQLLLDYDKANETVKASEYLNMMTSIGRTKKDRQQEMKKSQIDIEYSLKGLYDNKLSKEDREELLNIANNARKKGIATVKKGPIVFMNELIRKILSEVKGIKALNGNKILSLPQTKKQKEYDKLTNSEYMQSLDKDFRKAVRTERKKKSFENKIKVPNEPRTVDVLKEIKDNMDIIQKGYERLIDENGKLRQELYEVKNKETNIESNEEVR